MYQKAQDVKPSTLNLVHSVMSYYVLLEVCRGTMLCLSLNALSGLSSRSGYIYSHNLARDLHVFAFFLEMEKH